MATSTFTDNIVVGKDAAKILIEGLRGAKLPWPESRKDVIERSGEESDRILSSFRKLSQAEKR